MGTPAVAKARTARTRFKMFHDHLSAGLVNGIFESGLVEKLRTVISSPDFSFEIPSLETCFIDHTNLSREQVKERTTEGCWIGDTGTQVQG